MPPISLTFGRFLDLRPGEGRVALVLFTHLFFVTAAAIVLSAAKNGLFLSAYPASLIPHVIVASAVTTAAFAVVFAGVTGSLPRRALIEWTVGLSALSLVLSRAAFLVDPRTSFALYLWFSILAVVVMTLAWGAVGDLLTGRQARRMMPLLIGGTSVAGVGAGFGLAPVAALLGTPDLLLGGALALVLAGAVLRLAPPPAAAPAGASETQRGKAGGGEQGFTARVFRGALQIRSHRLLSLLAVGVALTAVIGTLVDYQFKAVLQDGYDRDAITALFGVLAGAVGLGSLVFQWLASRLLFRRWGLVAGAYAQAVLIGGASALVAATGGLAAVVLLRFMDETARFTLGKTVEQVSVAPYLPETRGSALTVLGGVLKPLATAATGVLLLFAAPLLGVQGLAVLTAFAAGALFLLFRRHPALYRAALEEALARHTLQMGQNLPDGALTVVDKNALDAVDRALASSDPALQLFAISILRGAPDSEALPRLERLLSSPVDEVRAESATAVVEAVGSTDLPVADAVRRMLALDPSPDVVRALLAVADGMGPAAVPSVERHLQDPDQSVRWRALVALARCERRFGGERAAELTERILESDAVEDRLTGLEAVGALGLAWLAEPAFRAATDQRTRAAAVAAFIALGPGGDPWIDRLLAEANLDDADLGPVATELAEVGHQRGLGLLLAVAMARGRVGAVVRPLQRARRRGRIDPLSAAMMRKILLPVLGEGARSGLLADILGGVRDDVYAQTIRDDLLRRHSRAAGDVLAGLSLAYDPIGLDRIAPHLRGPDPVARSNAMELLEGILELEDRLLVVSFFEGFESPERLVESARVAGASLDFPDGDPLEALARSEDPWLRACARFLREGATVSVGADSLGALPSHLHRHMSPEEKAMLPLMEIVFFLKSSPLFRALPGEELVRVARLADSRHLEPGEVLFQQGDSGDAFYIVVSGLVDVEIEGRRVASSGAREGIGEMALLDGQPRSATVRAVEPTTLLRIDQGSFEALLDRSPALAKGIFQVLCERLRAANIRAGAC